MIRIERDPDVDSAYIYLVGSIRDGEAVTQMRVQPPKGNAEILLDFDEEGKFLGIEVLGASEILRP